MKSPVLRLGSLPPIQVGAGTLVAIAVLAVIVHPVLVAGAGIPPAAAVLLALGVALFMILSVLVHEVGHALLAHTAGATVDHIALTLWGGHTQYRGAPLAAAASVAVSLAGPAGNLALAALTAAAAALVDAGSPAAAFWGLASWLNLALAVFNLLPGLPMDGGRALEALLGGMLGNRYLGTRVTAWIGRGIAVVVVAAPLVALARSDRAGTASLLTIVWAVLIAGMLWQGASQALAAARLEHRIRALDASALAVPHRIVAPGTALDQLDQLDQLGGGPVSRQLLVLDRAHARPGTLGRAHRVDPAAVARVPPEQRAAVDVAAVTVPVGEVGLLPADLQGEALIDHLLRHPLPLYVVVDAQGAPVGVLETAAVNALLRGTGDPAAPPTTPR